MRIGVPAETRAGETRVAATPETVKKLAAKNEVRIQQGAGAGSNIPDREYEAAGAKLVASRCLLESVSKPSPSRGRAGWGWGAGVCFSVCRATPSPSRPPP